MFKYYLGDSAFDWDPGKNLANIKKHGIIFKEAAEVFRDIDAVYIYDGMHSYDEDRFIVVGLSKLSQVLMVCHCYRDNGNIIRIISARKATKAERAQYGGR